MMKCPRCVNGQIGKDWDGRVCIQCGHRPDDYQPSSVQAKLRREAGKREPRTPKGSL